MNSNPKHTNALINASSPYLLQHAHNPVNWQPWSPEIWEQAKREDKMVLVSVGYSACHWCHVMEHECFEDEQTAELMNKWFINVKVDREERPDVDMVYMDACQLMTGRGGWPLNVFCLPDGLPVFAGTYFPNEKWQQTLIQLHTLWTTDRDKALEYAGRVQEGMKSMSLTESGRYETPLRKDIPALYETMSAGFDWEHGGPNRAPKFPLPNNYEFLLDYHLLTGNDEALDFTNLTLLKMANGGIYDHLRGGFCRYSVDQYWFAPHFEKMLYDNAQLISLYSRASAITGAPLYQEVARECLSFCRKELFSGNAYYSALDADSEGIEGRYYVFTRQEMEQVLSADELAFAETVFTCTPAGNWEHSYNILHRQLAPLQVLEQLNLDVNSYTVLLRTVKNKLKTLQESRPRPGLDHKIITAWNGLMLKALSDAALYLNDNKLLAEATSLADFLWNSMWDGRQLSRIYARDQASITGFLEDYALLAEGLLQHYAASGNETSAQRALLLAETAIRQFRDGESGVFYFTPSDGEELIVRKTDLSDDVINSASSVMAHVLCRLGVLYSRPAMTDMGLQLGAAVQQQLKQYPGWYSNWGRLSLAAATGVLQVECTGSQAFEHARLLQQKLPSTAVIAAAAGQSELPVFKGKDLQAGLIYICLGTSCLEPVDSVEKSLEICQDLLEIQP